MASQPFASIIIPCKNIDDYTEECVKHCLGLSCKNFEAFVLPDHEQEVPFDDPRVKVIPTGVAKPSEKRNIGIKSSNGEICVFSDADAFPDGDWFKNAVKYLKDDEVVATPC